MSSHTSSESQLWSEEKNQMNQMEQPYHFKMQLIFRKSDINKVPVKSRNRRAISAGFLSGGCHQWRRACQENVFCFLYSLRREKSVNAHSTHIVVSWLINSVWITQIFKRSRKSPSVTTNGQCADWADLIDRYVIGVFPLRYYHFLKSVTQNTV